MPGSRTIIRAVGTSLTRSSTIATLDAVAVAILALFKAGGTYDLGIDRAWLQWDGTDLDVVLEDDSMSALAADISTRNTAISDGLNSLTEITSVTTGNIETVESAAMATAAGTLIGVDYAEDSWDEHWEDPTSLPSGWALDVTGAAPDTVATYPAVGAGTAIQLDSDSDGKAQISKTFTALTTATTWEIRTEIKAADLGTTAVNLCLRFFDGARGFQFRPRTTGLGYYNGSTLTAAPVTHTVADGDWLVYTIRRVGDAVYVWIGPFLLWVGLYTAFGASTSNDGVVALGNGDTGVRTASIRRFSIRTGSVNEAPPEYTMRGTTHGR